MRTIALILVLSFSSAVSAATYYVATSGKDSNPGTMSQPFASWKKGAESAYPGDTIYIRGGIYYLTGVRPWIYIKPNDPYAPIGRSGTSVNKIYMWAYPPDYAAGNIPILDCKDAYHDNPTNFSALNFNKAEYWHVKGLTIRNNYQRTSSFLPQGIGCEGCANMIFENCIVHNISGRGFYYTSGFYNPWDDEVAPTLFECDTTYFINCDAYNLCDSVSSNPGNAADGFKAGSYQNGYLSFSGCRAWNYSDDGFDVHGNGIRTFDHCWAMSTHKYVSFGMEGNGYKFTGRGLQAWYGDAPTYPLVRMTNCIAAYCYYTGIYNNLYNIEGPNYSNNNGLFLNNTSYECRRGISDGYIEADPHIGGWYNNISYCPSSINPYGWPYNVEMPWYASEDYAESHNTWDRTDSGAYWVPTDTVTVTNDDFVSLDSSQIRLPRKPDGSLPDITFLKLVSTSDLIDAGKNVGLPFYGSAPDIGYSEFSTGSINPPIPLFLDAIAQSATPARIEMTYNLTLANIIPATSAFTVKVNSVTRSVSSIAIVGTKVLLTLTSPIVYGDIITIAYTKPTSNPLQTASGGQAASFTAQNATNNVAAISPVYVSSVVENAAPAKIEMTYNITLANITPATSAFAVRVNSNSRTVSSVTISGTKVTLTLASSVVYGDVVTVAYTKPATNPLQTSAGGQAVSLAPQSVINNISLSANQPPSVSIASPTKNISFVSPATITIEAIASDPDGTITKVEFYNGSTKLGEKILPPFSFTWKDVSDGQYSLTVVATDNNNARAVSEALSVTVEKSGTAVNQMPIVNITSPKKGEKSKKHDNILIEVTATDPDGVISNVELKCGNITLSEMTNAPYTYLWENVDTGTYVITAIATDNLGASTTSTSLELQVADLFDVNSEIINLYPNPNNGNFTVDIISALPGNNNRLNIINLLGKTIYSCSLVDEAYTRYIDISSVSSGNYILIVSNGEHIVTTKKIIKN